MKKNTIVVVMALAEKPNLRQVRLLKLLKSVFGRNLIIKSSQAVVDFNCSELIKTTGALFDFGRYHTIISTCNDNDIIVAFNDTFGNGRKLNIGAMIFILLSIVLLKLNVVDIAGPVDKDKYGKWLSPYFFVARGFFLKQMNWTNFRQSKSQTPGQVKEKLHCWLNSGWRSRKLASKSQRHIKLKTLYLERSLVNFHQTRVFAFSRSSIFRQMNRFL